MDVQTPTPDPTPYGLSLRDGRPRTSRYYAVIGDPPRCGPGDCACALTYLHKIEAALMQGGWTAYEANRLQKLQVRWTRFAFGRDPRFNLVGIRDGRQSKEVEQEIWKQQKRAPKYGYTRHGSPRTSAYFATIGVPPFCAPADYITAAAYLLKIEQAIANGGWKTLPNAEYKRLMRLKDRWARRASGQDPRFNLVGTREGRLKADVEYHLKPKQKRAEEARRNRQQIQDQRRNPERKWVKDVDADLPSGKAKGARNSMDPDIDVFEPEPGDVALPNIPPARQYLIPGQDTKGHAHRVYCRVMPAHYRALCALERSKAFGFRTVGDTIRWCIDYGVRELSMRANVPQSMSALAQVDAIREVLLDEQYYLEFPQMFELMTTTINRHLSAGAEGEAVRLIAIVRNQIEQMAEPYWKEKFMSELMRHYGNYIDGSRAASADFGGEGSGA